MAAISSRYPLGSPQEHIPMCEKHDLTIDMTCENCDEFICSQCAKTDHKDHDWKTISTAGSLRRRELKKTLSKVKVEDVTEIDEKIKKASKQIEDNQTCCDSKVTKLQNQFDAIVSKLKEIKENYGGKLKEDLVRKNGEVSGKKIDLEKKKKQVMDLVKFLEEKHSTMSDYSLIENLRDLSNLLLNRDCDLEKGEHSVKYRKGDINEGLLESMMGQTFDLDDFNVTETDSFQYGDEGVFIIEAINGDTSFIKGIGSGCIEKINRKNEKETKISINVNDVCVTDNGDLYATDFSNRSVVHLSPSGSVSTVFSAAPLVPLGICQSTEGGLLVSLRDIESERYQLDSSSRRLVRHVTLNGDVICEYEFREDGQTRLFTVPWRVKQSTKTDICVVNRTSESTGELMILSLTGSLKFVYRGQKLEKKFKPTDVVFDSHCNIIVSDISNNKIHLLSPDGEFMKYLLTEKDITDPCSMSFHKPTLWVGNYHGIVKVFHFNKT
ncbi:E3 ubiquitin-protein ligase TRIM71-like [Magallana gigas]|uniref:E3 ubiquitin-protein ligase TRIM71-like n=1 Tax=Magallana gigas TaxID=29159 RepID=UPI0033405866